MAFQWHSSVHWTSQCTLDQGKGCDLETWKTIWPILWAISNLVHHFVAIGEFKLELQSGNPPFGSKSAIFAPCDLEIWWMTLKNNRAPLLCYIKICTSIYSQWRIQTRVTARKRPNWCKICFDLCDLDLWLLTLTFCMDITSVNGNNSCKCRVDTMTGTLWKRCDRRTDRRTDGRTDWSVLEAAWSQLKTYYVWLHRGI